MRGRIVLGAALAAAVLAAAATAQEGPASPSGVKPGAPEAGPPESSPKAVLEGLDRIIRKLRANDGALPLHASPSKAKKAFPGAAVMSIEHVAPLGGSFLDPSGTLHGSIRWTFDDGDSASARVDTIQVILLTGKVDREAIRSTLKSAGKAVGLDLEPDEEDPDTWWDVDAKKVDVWVAVGDGVVVVDADPEE